MAIKIIVIGAGPGGYVAAVRAAQLGAAVTVIERDRVGGTCLNWGCIPSKILKTTAELLDRFKRASEFSIEVSGDMRPDLKDFLIRKEKTIQNQARGISELFRHHKIDYVHGDACLQRANTIQVTQKDGRIFEMGYDKLILALGSRPSRIPSFPFDGVRIISSNEALDLQKLPESILIVGGGVIGCEFACIFSCLGSKVTLVEALSRILPLPSIDEECSKILLREMKKRQIDVLVDRTAESWQETETALSITIGPSPFLSEAQTQNIKTSTVHVKQVLICIGRSPNTTGVGLETIGVQTDDQGWIIVDDRMETSKSGVYAIGDALGPSKVMLAHVASAEGMVAAENAMGRKRSMSYSVVPGAIFTIPEVAHVGLTETQAKAHGVNVRSDSVLFRSLGKAHVIGEIAGQAKIVSNADNGDILGVHIIGPHATDLIGEASLALQMGGRVQDLADTIHAHPTLSEIIMETSFKALDRALHG